MKQGKIKIEQANNPENMVMIDSLNFYRFLPKIEIEGVYKNRTTKRTFGEDKNQQIEVVVSKHFLRKGELWEEETVKDSVKIVSYEKDLYIIFKAIATNPDVTGFLDIFVSTLPDAEKYATETIRYQTATDFSGYPFSVFNGTFDRYYQNGNRLIFNESNFKEGNGVAYFHIGFHFSREPKKDFYIDFFAYDYDADIFRPDKERFHRMKIKVSVLNIATYHIYHDGRIEKHIPKNIQQNNQYKYVYHDEKGGVHEVCTLNRIIADKRNNGKKESIIPKKYIKTYNYPEGGNAQTAYVTENETIFVSGSVYGIRSYSKGIGQVELVRMPDSLNYVKGNTKIIFSFSNSQRRYCNPDCMAGFIGVLAELKKEVECTGMCFSDATSYPSLTHPNGDSADTEYFTSLTEEQKKVDAFKKFHFTKIYRGDTGWYPSLKNTSYSSGHNDHLHAGDFDNSKIKIIQK